SLRANGASTHATRTAKKALIAAKIAAAPRSSHRPRRALIATMRPKPAWSHSQSKREPSCPAQSAVTLYTGASARLERPATYSKAKASAKNKPIKRPIAAVTRTHAAACSQSDPAPRLPASGARALSDGFRTAATNGQTPSKAERIKRIAAE